MSQQMDWTGYGGSAAEIYERHMVPAIFGPWAEDLLAFGTAEARRASVGCGLWHGVVARLWLNAWARTGQWWASDLNPGMLAVARTLPPPQGAPIEWREGNVSAIPFPDATFDLALCQQGLQFFPDRPAALREMRRVLAPRWAARAQRLASHAVQPWLRSPSDSSGTPHSPRGGRDNAGAFRARERRRPPHAHHRCRLRRGGRAACRQVLALSVSPRSSCAATWRRPRWPLWWQRPTTTLARP